MPVISRPRSTKTIISNNLVCAAVLSGNRNFEARIHPNLKANFLASPPLVVAYAIAGTVLKDLMTEPLGKGSQRQGRLDRRHLAKFRRDLCADEIRNGSEGVRSQLRQSQERSGRAVEQGWQRFRAGLYVAEVNLHCEASVFRRVHDAAACVATGVKGARALGIFGDSITTDHISPAGAIKDTSPAGKWLIANNVMKADFNSYGARRGNHEVMMRGTFANVRIKNLMIPPQADGSRIEGGLHVAAAVGRADVDLRCRDEVHRRRAFRPSYLAARNTAPARHVTGRPKARSCWVSRR